MYKKYLSVYFCKLLKEKHIYNTFSLKGFETELKWISDEVQYVFIIMIFKFFTEIKDHSLSL